jgi:hypothetical protein
MATTVFTVDPATTESPTGESAMLTAPPALAVTVNAIVDVASATPVPRARTITFVAGPPAVALAEAARERELLVAPALSVAGVNVAVTPVGRFSAVSETSPLKLVRATVMAAVPAALCATESVGAAVETAMLEVGTGWVGVFLPPHAVSARILEATTNRTNLLCIGEG